MRSLGERSLPAKKMVHENVWVSDTPISAMKWKIIKDKDAEKLHITEVEGSLIIKLSEIPNNMSVDTFINFIQATGIVVKE